MGEKMNAAIDRLRDIKQANLLGGGEKHIQRQHSRDKLTARERIDCLLDPGTFNELGSCVNTTGARIDGRKTDAPCDGAVVGTGKVSGRPMVVYASDFTVLGGSLGAQHVLKFVKLMEMAAEWGVPMVWLLDSSGGRLGYQDVPSAGIDWWFALQSRYSGLFPQINVLMGPCIAGQAYCPTLCDFLLMSRKTAHLWLGGPRMTQAATSEKIGDDVGGADYHMAYSGTCDVVGDTDEKTILKTRDLMGYLPSNCREKPPFVPATDDIDRDISRIVDIVPEEYDKTYDMHDVIELLVDDGEIFEIKDEYAKNLITCFCRFNGEAVGLVASNPKEPGSIYEINACDKYYRFLQVLDAYNIPLVNLTDTAATVAGESQEEKGLLRHMGKILDVYATAKIPKISIILREAYADAGSLIMGGVKSMGTDICYAWPIARFAVEASTLDYFEIYGKGVEPDAHTGYLNRSREKIDVFDAAGSWTAQVVDEVIEPFWTRRKIIEALAMVRTKKISMPPRAKMHSTAPS
ncbi:MAG: propionyl-CoA carboxylase [Deltaproteobacteria bacterium]|nr:propionyl-CoA carboxylase [Deltaproteobacteria bacterium]